MNSETEMEARAMRFDLATDEPCARCSHGYHYHISVAMVEAPCDFETIDEDGGSVMCECLHFEEHE